MEMKGYQQYKEQAVTGLTQGELLLLLYDELVKRIGRAELALDKGDFALLDASVTRSKEIIHYLDDTLNPQYPISAELSKLYEFFCYELSRVETGRSKQALLEIKPMIVELRDSFRTAEKNVAEGQGGPLPGQDEAQTEVG